MSPWGWIGAAYGVTLAIAAVSARDVARRQVAAVAAVAYACVALAMGTLTTLFWVQLVVPGLLLLVGYWLSGFFFRNPQAWLEQALRESDDRVFSRFAVNRVLARTPRWVLEVIEASYAADYVVVGGGAFIAAAAGIEAVSSYWTLVLGAELACYVALPWLRSRPPRSLEPPGAMDARRLTLRRFNAAILDRASVQANTLPSGHVAGAVAAALAVLTVNPLAGGVLLAVAVLIAIAAVVGRYHYVIDCVTGAVVAIAVWGMI